MAERKPSPRPRHAAAAEAGHDEAEQVEQAPGGVESVVGDMAATDAVPDSFATADAVTHPLDGDEPELPGREVGGTCNVAGCPDDAVTRGLCDGHWCTHRGLADPLPVEDVED